MSSAPAPGAPGADDELEERDAAGRDVVAIRAGVDGAADRDGARFGFWRVGRSRAKRDPPPDEAYMPPPMSNATCRP